MNKDNSVQKHTILIVDDEVNVIQSLKRLFRKEPYNLLTSSTGPEGLEILKENPVDLILSDQRMPGMSGVEFLTKVREQFPDIIRIVLSGYTDVNTITAAINDGNVYKFILKPWEDHQLKDTVREALKVHQLKIENKRLNKEVQKKNEELLIINENLKAEVRKRVHEIVQQTKKLEMARDILESLPVAVTCINKDNHIVYANGFANILFSESGKQLLGSALNDVFNEGIKDIITASINTCLPQRAIIKIINSYPYSVKCTPIWTGDDITRFILSFSEMD